MSKVYPIKLQSRHGAMLNASGALLLCREKLPKFLLLLRFWNRIKHKSFGFEFSFMEIVIKFKMTFHFS